MRQDRWAMGRSPVIAERYYLITCPCFISIDRWFSQLSSDLAPLSVFYIPMYCREILPHNLYLYSHCPLDIPNYPAILPHNPMYRMCFISNWWIDRRSSRCPTILPYDPMGINMWLRWHESRQGHICSQLISNEPTNSLGFKTELMWQELGQSNMFNCLAYDWFLLDWHSNDSLV